MAVAAVGLSLFQTTYCFTLQAIFEGVPLESDGPPCSQWEEELYRHLLSVLISPDFLPSSKKLDFAKNVSLFIICLGIN